MSKTKLLYIESSSQIQGWVVRLLNKMECETTQAFTLNAAQTKIEKDVPLNIVLLGDLTRPTDQVSGIPNIELSIIKAIRERPTYKETKIIVFSSADYSTEALRDGANAFLAKPAGAVELQKILRPHLLSAVQESAQQP